MPSIRTECVGSADEEVGVEGIGGVCPDNLCSKEVECVECVGLILDKLVMDADGLLSMDLSCEEGPFEVESKVGETVTTLLSLLKEQCNFWCRGERFGDRLGLVTDL